MLDPCTGSCCHYSLLLWKTANPVHLKRTNFQLKASYPAFRCCQSQIHTVCILQFVHEVANTVDPWLATERCNMSVLLLFFMTSMVVAATFLMFCHSVSYFPVCSSIMILLLKKLVWKVMVPCFFPLLLTESCLGYSGDSHPWFKWCSAGSGERLEQGGARSKFQQIF